MTTLSTTKLSPPALRVFIDGEPLGTTFGDVSVEVVQEVSERRTNEFGYADSIVTDNGRLITIPLAQFEPATLAKAIPGSQLVTSGTRNFLYSNSTRGRSLIGDAVTLTLSGNLGDTAHQYTYKAAFAESGFEYTLGDDQSVIEVVFRAVADPANPDAVDAIEKYETFPV